jgi:HAD superfamily hydrolase (TIGR01509 family)
MARPAAIIFDFDGVLVDSEFVGNRLLAESLSALGHSITVDDALDHFVGLSGRPFLDAIEAKIGAPLPTGFIEQRRAQSRELLDTGVAAVAGAVEFVRALPPALPKALASSSSTEWMRAHLRHLGLAGAFGDRLYSGHEHVERGKPAPDLYLFAAKRLGVPIHECAIIEDSRLGATGALASGARVVGLCAGSHCRPGHGEMLRSIGVRDVANSFDDIRALLDL